MHNNHVVLQLAMEGHIALLWVYNFWSFVPNIYYILVKVFGTSDLTTKMGHDNALHTRLLLDNVVR
jgi:hypothetical protein